MLLLSCFQTSEQLVTPMTKALKSGRLSAEELVGGLTRTGNGQPVDEAEARAFVATSWAAARRPSPSTLRRPSRGTRIRPCDSGRRHWRAARPRGRASRWTSTRTTGPTSKSLSPAKTRTARLKYFSLNLG